MLPFLFTSTAVGQSFVDTTSYRYVAPTSKPVDDRAVGTIAKPTVNSEPAPPPVVTTPAKPSFSFGNSTRLQHGPAVVINGCSKNTLVRMGKGKSEMNCGPDYMHPKMAAHMEKTFFKCAVEAAEDAGIARPARMYLQQAGVFQNRTIAGSSRMSLHAQARAIDIVNFNLYDANGNLTRISTNVRDYRGRTKSFYDSFRQCWQRKLPSACHGRYSREREGSIGLPGSEGSTNWDHADHLHLSFPPCGG